ncbi:hypothetical protein [Cryobacterium sp. Y50]|uniref:hypothetical protein n=1 Tax=Cryobacterium sp. Y50 TaxID=2048286 RepID=UPI001304ABC6|nr:hypothetical protein [Cryobacterium sp. Y50]
MTVMQWFRSAAAGVQLPGTATSCWPALTTALTLGVGPINLPGRTGAVAALVVLVAP